MTPTSPRSHNFRSIACIVAAACVASPMLLRAQSPADATAAASDERTGSRATAAAQHDGTEQALGDLEGLRPWLAVRGMTLEAFLLGDLSRNFRGGLTTGREVFRHLLEVAFTLDTEASFGHAGGTLFADFQTQAGRQGSDLLVGDAQGFSNLDADGFTAFYELWYQQLFAGGRLRLKVGKIDANNEFAFVENGVLMLNSSAGFSPTILGFPTYPDPATGAVLFASPADWLYVGGGLFDGATQAGFPTGTRGPATFFGEPDDIFLVAEAGIRRAVRGGRLRRFGVGVTHHTGTFDRVDGSAQTEKSTEEGATSYYAVLDQRLADRSRPTAAADSDDPGPGLDGFLQLGSTSDRLSPIDLHVGAGLVGSGYIPGRARDHVGLMATWVRFGDAARAEGSVVERYELALELFYQLRLTPWLSLQPDLQYIVNPGGSGIDDALVGTLRLELAL